MDGALVLGAASRCATAVDDDHGEPLVGEPLRTEVGVVRLHDALRVRAAVRVHQHGKRLSRRDRAAAARRWPSSVPADERIRTLGVTSAGSASDSSASTGWQQVPHAGLVEAAAATRPWSCRRLRPSGRQDRRRSGRVRRRSIARRVAPSRRRSGWRRTCTSSSPVATTARTCRSGGLTGSPSTSSRRAPSRSAHATRRPSARSAGRAGHQLDPCVVVIDEQHSRLAGRGIDLDDLDRTLVA